MRSNYLFACTLLLPFSVAIAAPAKPALQAAKPVISFFRGTPLPKWLAPLADVPPAVRSDPVVVRLSETQVWTGANPAYLVSRAILVNDKTRLREIGQIGLPYYPAYQKLHLHRVALLRGTEVIDRTATVNARLLEREPSLESGFYVGESTVQLLLEDVRVGDTLHLVFSVEGRNPVFGRLWADDFSWDYMLPTEQRRLTVSHPASQRLHWRELGDSRPHGIVPVVERNGTVERLRFDEKNLEAYQPEAGVPASYLPFRKLQLSEYGSWQEVAAWASSLFERPTASPELKSIAAQFASGRTEEERASAALHWVQDEIRYFSVALGENSHRPQPPDAVLRRRFGDCKDKTTLLIAVLAQLGIKSEPVLVNAQAPEFPQKLLPTPSWFDHVIVRVVADGVTYYVDPTREGEKGLLSQLPSAIPGAAALVVAADTTALVTLPEQATGFPLYDSSEKFIVNDLTGDVQLEVTSSFRAQYARFARARYAAMSAAELRQDMLGDYDKQFRGATLSEPPIVRDSDDGTVFSVSARLRLPKPVKEVDGWYALSHKNRVMDGTLGIPEKLSRSAPFAPPLGMYQGRYRLHIVWPEEVKLVNVAEAKTIDNAFFRAHKEFSWRGNEVDYVLDYKVKRKQIEASELPELESQSKLLEPLMESTLQFNAIGTVKSKAVSIRDGRVANAALMLTQLTAAPDKIQAKDDAARLELLCDSLLDLVFLGDIYPSSRSSIGPLVRKLDAISGQDAGKAQCRGRAAFEAGNYRQALDHFSKAAAVSDDDAQLLSLAWARLGTGDAVGAMADTQRFVQARLVARTLAPDDAALAMLLLQRCHAAMPAALDEYARAMPDGPWPRPVMEFLAGRMIQQELLRLASGFAPVKRESALNEAWFYIGAKLRLEGKKQEALQALRWFPVHGIWRSLPFVLAQSELKQLRSGDPDLEAGLEASNADRPDFRKAQEHFAKAAARGNASAEMELGFLAEHGKLGKADPQTAFVWYQRSAQHGDRDGMNALAVAYDDGLGVEKDAVLAVQWFQRAAEGGHYFASRNLGRFYAFGLGGLPRDQQLAFAHYFDAAQLGHAGAQAEIGRRYLEGEGTTADLPLALYWNSRAAEGGNADGMAQLAFMMAYGHGIKEDRLAAIKLWTLAAGKGAAAARVQLGNAYQRGRGVEKDLRLAFEWFSKSALDGNPYAIRQLAEAYLDGDGVTADPVKARAHFNVLVNMKDANGYYGLARMAEDGKDGPVNLPLAEQHFRSCAELGDAWCMHRVGTFLHSGKNGPKDPAGAALWYRRAADKGISNAMNNLADLYEKGEGVATDLPQAISLYRQAAQDGNATALFSLGELNEQGKGMPANAYFAYVYFELAHLNEYKAAAARRDGVASQLSEKQIAMGRQLAKSWARTQPLPDTVLAAP
jgi:TPR repeat protein